MNTGTSLQVLTAAIMAATLSATSLPAAAASTAAMEKQIQALQDQLNSLRAELQAVKAAEPSQTQQVQQLDTRVSKVESAVQEAPKPVEARVAKLEQWSATVPPKVSGNMVFFRGGYLGLSEDRGNGVFSDLYNVGGLGANNNDTGWYAGAGFDFLLSRDTWGLLPGTWALAELGVEFGSVDSKNAVLTVPTAAATLVTGTLTPVIGDQQLLQMTVSASPKIKFFEGSKFRPWIIPVGLDFRVISPPSETSNYLDIGAQFAAGADYELIPGIKVGADFRYHLAAGLTNPDYSAAQRAAFATLGITPSEPDNDYWTAGGYLGIGF